MTLNPPNELLERELDDLMKKLDKEKFDAQFHCDWNGKCHRKPFAEVYIVGGWSYLCLYHFIIALLTGHRKKWYGWCKAGVDDE